jgi:uncharacterized protein (TIGR00255 family)
MTGFAQVRRQTAPGTFVVNLRSVNHRGLDLHFHQAGEFAQFETAMRSLIKERIARGHIEIRASLVRENETGGAFLNREVLKQYADAFRAASTELRIEAPPDLNLLLGLPGVLNGASEAKQLDAGFQPELLAALEECVISLNECREREGKELAAAILSELTDIEAATRQILELRAQALPQFHQRLKEKLSELLGSTSISDVRLAEEAAILADRSDIHEELTRLAVHAQELRRIVEKGGLIGKPLDFLLQEMNRETNTTLSKNAGVGEVGLKITSLALAVKANIERIREQALNLE